MSSISSGGASGGGDTLAVDTEALKVTAPVFQRNGEQVDTLLQNLKSAVDIAGNDMFLLLEFARMVSMLEQLQERIGVAMQCAAGGLKRIGTVLEIASGLYVENEDTLSTTFIRLKDDPNVWKSPIKNVPQPIEEPFNPMHPITPNLPLA